MDDALRVLVIRLEAFEGKLPEGSAPEPMRGDRVMEFHVARSERERLGVEGPLFRSTGNLVIPDFRAARQLARRMNERLDAALLPERAVKAGRLNAMALIDEILHDVARLYREKVAPAAFSDCLRDLEAALGKRELDRLLLAFTEEFPPLEVYEGRTTAKAWLEARAEAPGLAGPDGPLAAGGEGAAPSNRELALEEFLLFRIANENPAFGPFRFLFDDGLAGADYRAGAPRPGSLAALPAYAEAAAAIDRSLAATAARLGGFGPDGEDLASLLRAPMRAEPFSLPGQLDYIRRRWGLVLGDRLLRILGGLDLIREEEKPRFPGPGPTRAYAYAGLEREYERFSPDRDWMPNVVMMAKSTLVWLDQLSKRYATSISRLDQVPDQELDELASRGFNALWLIGLWERSEASARIKRSCGNPEAAASAYSLHDYEIAGELGGWAALEGLKARCSARGIRLAADMVPNHTGVDSAWVRERPELFMQTRDCPFPSYTFGSQDLSGDPSVDIRIEDHYYDRTDAAVVFRRVDRRTGETRYIYHGNDGTGLPWSDTAQIDFLKAEAREAVKERILHVAKAFPVIRFDAAMVLAKKHFRRLWYPEPGSGGDIASRAERALSPADFDAAFPEEFWREVVDLCAREAPDTLLLAEAFWMMEGYFVRTLGMHRVYNSAFMNMLKREENAKYRETVRNTQEFDKDILKRFVNFMNNPDEDTAVAQFGSGDKYFGVCTLMATMPGLPMFGHGQLEGLTEKYGMEYRRAYKDEVPDRALVERHEREIFPLLKRRRLFSGVEEFLLYDLVAADGSVNENVFAYSNGAEGERCLVVYNNAYARAEGRIRESCPYAEKLPGGQKRLTRRGLAAALGLAGGGPASGTRERFLVLREQRSSLWFLRRSREIAESGLAVGLDGYQSQVFLDLFEVEDDERGLYGALCEALGGRGVPDLGEALQDLALKELYALLARLAGPRYFELAGELGARPEAGAELLARSGEPALDFFAALRAALREAAVEEGLPGDSGRPSAEADLAAALAARDRLLSGLARLAALAAPPAAARAEPAEAVTARGATGAARPAGIPADEAGLRALAREPASARLAAALLVLDALAPLVGPEAPEEEARRLAERFYLPRKLREALREAGTPGDAAHRGLALAAALAARSAALTGRAKEVEAALPALALGLPRRLLPSRPLAPQPEAAAPAADAAPERAAAPGRATARGRGGRASPAPSALPADEELRSLVGANLFDGVDWFNKERMEELLVLALLAQLSAGPAERPISIPAADEGKAAAGREDSAAKAAREGDLPFSARDLGERERPSRAALAAARKLLARGVDETARRLPAAAGAAAALAGALEASAYRTEALLAALPAAPPTGSGSASGRARPKPGPRPAAPKAEG